MLTTVNKIIDIKLKWIYHIQKETLKQNDRGYLLRYNIFKKCYKLPDHCIDEISSHSVKAQS